MHLDLSENEWKEYAHAVELFNSKYFWECHEVLEDIWMTKQPPLKTFLQGIIQAAAAFYHVLNENPKGVVKLAQDALNKFQSFEDSYLGLEILSLKKSLERFKEEAKEILENKKTLFDLEKIPVLKLVEPLK